MITDCECGHPKDQHETYEYRGDKARHCLTESCLCRRYKPRSSGSKLVFGTRRIVSRRLEEMAKFDLPAQMFAEAYAELRRSVPNGDLIIHLYIEADSAEEVGVKWEDEK